jgi:hypothetical protein
MRSYATTRLLSKRNAMIRQELRDKLLYETLEGADVRGGGTHPCRARALD